MASIDSDHINYLVYRYLQESGDPPPPPPPSPASCARCGRCCRVDAQTDRRCAGFQHSSFTFGYESGVTRSAVAGTKIPAGSLITQLQRALSYAQAEICLLEDGVPADPKALEEVETLSLIESVQPDVCDRRRADVRRHQAAAPEADEAGAAMEVEVDVEARPEAVRVLDGHSKEVVACAWSPQADVLATGSGDSTARLWSRDASVAPVVLQHPRLQGDRHAIVVTVEWNHTGTLLATGSYDGIARLWTGRGQLKSALEGHTGPVFSLKWSRTSTRIVSCSLDKTTIVWDVASGLKVQVFACHAEPCLDVDWASDSVFASCSQDRAIHICEVGKALPLQSFTGLGADGSRRPAHGHSDDVNTVRWDPSGTHLASCSDDRTAKVWTRSSDTVLHTFTHTDKVYSLAWGTGSPVLLATASFDSTAKVWDVQAGSLLYSLSGHTRPVYAVAFSPDGRRLASGSTDNRLLIWSMETGKVELSFHGKGGVYSLDWNQKGDCIGGSFTDNTAVMVEVV